MTVRRFERLAGHRGALLEGPVSAADGSVLYADATNGGVFRHDLDGHGTEVVVPHRRGIGGMVPHADGGVVVTGRNVAHKALSGQADEPTSVLLEEERGPHHSGYNDLTTDGEGRIWVGSIGVAGPDGSVASMSPGRLLVLDLDGGVREVHAGLGWSNGLGFSPDGRTLYHADTGAGRLLAHEVDPDEAVVRATEVLLEVDTGLPDGLAVDVEGRIWLALVGAGLLRVLAADGSIVEDVEVPLPGVTTMCFGRGAHATTLFVATTVDAGTDDEAALFAVEVGVEGLPVVPARVPLPGP